MHDLLPAHRGLSDKTDSQGETPVAWKKVRSFAERSIERFAFGGNQVEATAAVSTGVLLGAHLTTVAAVEEPNLKTGHVWPFQCASYQAIQQGAQRALLGDLQQEMRSEVGVEASVGRFFHGRSRLPETYEKIN
ncbi:hypothetical protein SDC9_178130 [bioreactor metagenome]|uniref:Uncharacterized protein n=1 Tax=bioreactor metagenome TaxID=1076179 RepID=A0A645GY36_9ZZZZ